MHPVLNLESYGADTKTYQSLKETLVQPSFGSFFAHNDWAQLTMITHQNNVFGSLENRNQGLWLSCLGSFINKYLSKSELSQSTVKGCYASRANNISIFQNFIFCLFYKVFESFIVFFIELSLFFFFLFKLFLSCIRSFVKVLYLFVKCQVINR